jgi:SAM-dependent methyltransferase
MPDKTTPFPRAAPKATESRTAAQQPVDAELYETIAPLYHLVYADWEESMRHQAAALDGIIREAMGPGPFSILDVSCGIGTQSIGLARLGHTVTASDLSAAAVNRARDEATRRGLTIDFSIADMRRCSDRHGRHFDVVLSADNSVPHLLSDQDLLAAFRNFYACTRPGGATLITIRDYARENRTASQIRPYGIRVTDSGRYIVFQCWESDGDYYDVTMYFLYEGAGGERTITAGRSRYYAVEIDKLLSLLHRAGFVDMQRIDGRYLQPVLLARRASIASPRRPHAR